MQTSNELTKKSNKRSFSEAWLNDSRYKSWIHKVSSDSSLYYCSICDKKFSCNTVHVSKHAKSACHNSKEKSLLCNNDNNDNNDNNLLKKKKKEPTFQHRWLDNEQFKCWLREVPHAPNSFSCSICDKSIVGGLSQIYRHAESASHITKYKIFIDTNKSNKELNEETNEFLSFDDRKNSLEIRYAALIAEANISIQMADKFLKFFQHASNDGEVLRSIKMARTKCTNMITHVLCPVETERVVNKIQNTKFTVFIDETSDICNEKWMTFVVRYVDSETLDIRSQLVKLINIDAKDSSAEKLFHAFKCEMWKLQIPFSNIIALSCDNASVMTGKHVSFKRKLEEACPRLLTFGCPCHSAALAAHAACNKIPTICEEFLKKISNFINSSPKRSAIFTEFSECFQEKKLKILKLCDTRWLSHYLCVERLLVSWDTIKHFLTEIVVSEKTKPAEYLLSLMSNVELKAYFLFLKYVLNLFNAFNAFFQALETRIHLLQPKSVNFLFEVCQNLKKKEHLKPFSINVIFSLKENQKNLNEITLGSECDKYLNELMMQGHTDIVTTVRENCLTFYVTAADEIRKRLPVNNTFLSKLQVFRPYTTMFNTDRETLFNDVSVIAKTIGDIDEDALRKEWFALPSDFTMEEKQSLSKLNFDNLWKEILQYRYPNNTVRYPNLTKVLNAVRALPNSNADPERVFSLLTDIKTKKRNKLSPATVNAICVVKSAFKARGETAINMKIDEKHLSLLATKKAHAIKKPRSALRLYAADDIAGPSFA